jgi:hypothetical protein
MANALSDNERALVDAYWRSANYLSIGRGQGCWNRNPKPADLSRLHRLHGYQGRELRYHPASPEEVRSGNALDTIHPEHSDST